MSTLTDVPDMGPAWPIKVTVADGEPQIVGYVHAHLDGHGMAKAIADLLTETGHRLHYGWHDANPDWPADDTTEAPAPPADPKEHHA